MRKGLIFLALIAALVIVSAISLKTGAVAIPFPRLWAVFSGDGGSGDETIASIILKIRLPRLLLALLVGGALSTAGVLFQGLFRNPLVEPYTLGVSGGAALGVSLAVLLGRIVPRFLLPLFGFAGAGFAVLLAYAIARRKFLKISYLLLVGVMLSFISSSLIMLLMSVSTLSQFRTMIFWSMGSLELADPALLALTAAIILLAAGVSWTRALSLNAFALGEEGAAALGIRLEREKTVIFLLGSLLAGSAVAAAGVVGFVGLLVPHFTRLLIGNDHRYLLPASFLAGAAFLAACDTLARVLLSPAELPVGVITGVLGGIAFIAVLGKKQQKL
ncbi:MAG: iron ABC transporter permease [Candidatus Aureabacteria bacterium]|nr:iron ABC transporter permease [Candidatus Auribacterota bacterium]